MLKFLAVCIVMMAFIMQVADIINRPHWKEYIVALFELALAYIIYSL